MSMRGLPPARVARGLACLSALVGTVSCTVQDLTIVEPPDRVIAEVYVQLVSDLEGRDRVTAFLHRTITQGPHRPATVPGATVVVSRSDGFSVELAETSVEECVVTVPVGGTGTCYSAAAAFANRFEPEDDIEVVITTPDGGRLEGATSVPGAFHLYDGPGVGYCGLEVNTPLEVRWTSSSGAWAYVNETLITGIRDALAPEGIVVEEDPLYLLGLSISAADTTIVFPGEFGVFNRFELDQDLAAALQRGLPAETSARVTITAADRNYVNWVRGANFNPSGRIRLPSLRGDGTGVFAATVTTDFRVLVGNDDVDIPPCAGP